MSDEDALALARRALDGDPGSLLRLLSQLVRARDGEDVKWVGELPPINYTFRLPFSGNRGPGRGTRAEYSWRTSWTPPGEFVALSILSDIRADEVPLDHETRIDLRSRVVRLEQRIPTRFLLREPRRTAPFLPGFIFGKPYFTLFDGGDEARITFDNPVERAHWTEVYAHARVSMGRGRLA